ncbi:hypothetical protein [Azospirillum melinis]
MTQSPSPFAGRDRPNATAFCRRAGWDERLSLDCVWSCLGGVPEAGVENGGHLAHDSGDGDLSRLSGVTKTLMEGLD